MNRVTLYTDGACSGNPGPGGWGAILKLGNHCRELSGFEAETTNNRMEMRAAIEGLKALNRPCTVILHSDSSYLVDAFNKGWLENWMKRGWRKSNKDPVLNQDLWLELIALGRIHVIEYVKVRGHSDDALNNRCDELARAAIKDAKHKALLGEG